jgi:hypothetical protein
MRKPIPPAPSLVAGDLDAIKGFCEALNIDDCSIPVPTARRLVILDGRIRPVKQELRRLVQMWFAVDCNLMELLKAEPEMAKASRELHGHLVPSPDGRTFLLAIPELRNIPPENSREDAIALFLLFLMNPFKARLCRACKECDQYFVGKTSRHRVYCSRKCAGRRTSREKNRALADAARSKKIERAQRKLRKWNSGNRKEDWISYVRRNADVSKNLLTRAIRTGELDISCVTQS